MGTALVVTNDYSLPPLKASYLSRTLSATSLATLVAMLIALGAGFFLARLITRPLRELTDAAHAMAAGNMDRQVQVRSQDELGELALAFNQMSAERKKFEAALLEAKDEAEKKPPTRPRAPSWRI